MTKVPILIFFSFFSCKISFAQIRWNSDTLINYKNFKALSPKKSEFTALTSSQITSEYTCNTNCLSYTVEAIFTESESWMNDSSNYTLKHEILHFAIEEIFARKIRKHLKESYLKQLNDEIIKLKINQLLLECSRYQDLYDKQTNNSLNKKQQKTWSVKINLQLKELEGYSQVSYNYCKNKIGGN